MKVRLRGYTSQGQFSLYLDGIPIQVPYDGRLDFNRFLTNDIAEIEVAKGYSSPLLGANNLGGSINLVTREPIKQFEADAAFGSGSGELLMGSLQLGTRWEKFYLQGSADWMQRDYIPLSGNFPLQQPTKPSRHYQTIKDLGWPMEDAHFRAAAEHGLLTMAWRRRGASGGLWEPQPVEVGCRQGGHAQTRRNRRAQLRPRSGTRRDAPHMVARSRKRLQALSCSCRGLQSRHFNARAVRSRHSKRGRQRQICAPVRHSGRRHDHLRNHRRIRCGDGGAHCRRNMRSHMIKSRHFHRAAKRMPHALIVNGRQAARR